MNEITIPYPKDSRFLEFLYHTVPGRFLLKGLIFPGLSEFCGKFLDSSLSKIFIPHFVRKNGIRLSDYQDCDYRSFNDFFSRSIRPELRPVDSDPEHLIAPCDGLLSAYRITESFVIPVKQRYYTIDDLLEDPLLAAGYRNGTCLVFRLCVNHYHRYCYVDSGLKEKNTHIPGVLHTVRPVALGSVPVFSQNAREYTLIDSASFGPVVQMEVGALLVGKIENYHEACRVQRGQEKGRFLYGGSTIILLLKNNTVCFPEWVFDAAKNSCEIPVKMGEMIAKKAD
ncbi:MAG: phosphatidylserine decarboxylase [Eubacteriales bacterium]|nr:phosphatidylserine decarboxylase [Eubacteriales bacterium]